MSPSKPARVARLSRNACGGLTPIRSGNYELAFDRKAKRLVVTIDCAEAAVGAAVPWKSGKSRILSTTSGFVAVPVPGVPGLKLQVAAP